MINQFCPASLETYKQALTDAVQVNIDITVNNQSYQGVLRREDLLAIIEPVSRRTLTVCEQIGVTLSYQV